MSEKQRYDLKFHRVNYGMLEPTWDLEPLLYEKAARIDNRNVGALLDEGALGEIIQSRLALVIRLYEILDARLASGISRFTIKRSINNLRRLYTWAEDTKREITLETLESCFLDWADSLVYRCRIAKSLKMPTAFNIASSISTLIDEILEKGTCIIRKTRLSKSRRRAPRAKSEKQNLSEVFEFGRMILDISQTLTIATIRGQLPVEIRLRNGKKLVEWSGLMPLENVKIISDIKNKNRGAAIANRMAWETDTSWRTRHPLMNLKIEAELLIFIAQTGMNLAQAHKLKIGKFSYKSDTSGYKVRRIYKNRKQGEVEFSIYSEYRTYFEDYLTWRNELFGNDPDGLMFPISSPKVRSPDVAPKFSAIRRRCDILKERFIGPRELRKTRVNWLLRRLSDPVLIAEVNQHTEETLHRSYAEPNHQVASVEISRFIATTDPALAAPGPGSCLLSKPTLVANAPQSAPPPDCVNPAGCLFCEHQRDIASLDHYWSLVSYQYCKSLELSRSKLTLTSDNPAMAVIEAITKRLKIIETLDKSNAEMLQEAKLRVEEGEYHPNWDAFIQLMEFEI